MGFVPAGAVLFGTARADRTLKLRIRRWDSIVFMGIKKKVLIENAGERAE
jgi:hypothetical protein